MRVVILCLFVFITTASYCQKFDVVNAIIDLKGIQAYGNDIIHFGRGFTVVSKLGDVLFEKNIIDGASSSDVVDILEDKKGGLWILTTKELMHMNSDRTFVNVLNFNQYANSTSKDLCYNNEAGIIVLLSNLVIAVDYANKFSIIHNESDINKAYYLKCIVDQQSTIFVASYNNVYVFEKGKPPHTITLDNANRSIHQLVVTPTNKLMVLDYNGVLEIKDKTIFKHYTSSQLSHGLNFFRMELIDENDYWIYASAGNVFHFKNKTWTNFTPPTNLVTGNLGECMTRTIDGEIWMGLRGQNYLLRFDGLKWSKVNLKSEKTATNVIGMEYVNEQLILAKVENKRTALQYNGVDFVAYPPTGDKAVVTCRQDEKGSIYFSSDDGIYRVNGNSHTKMVGGTYLSSFGVINDEILYIQDGKLLAYENGASAAVPNNFHYLGFEEKLYGLAFYRLFNHKIAITSSNRPGLINVYDGQNWGKIIAVEDKKIGSIHAIFTQHDSSLVVTNNGSIALLKEKEQKWLYFNPTSDANKQVRKAYLTPDGAVWVQLDDTNVMVYRNGKELFFSFPFNLTYSIQGVLNVKPNVYHVYTGKNITMVDFN